jgi:hypothetical protein
MPLMAETPLSVNVPYPFVAGKLKLPAGAYTIQEDVMTGVITIRNNEGRTVVLLSGPGARTANNAVPSLTFVNVKGEMVLTAIQAEESPSRVLPVHAALPVSQ